MTIYNPRARIGKKRGILEPPSDFSLCAEHHITVTFDDETKEILRDINSSLQKLAGANKPTSQIIEEALLEPLGEPGSMGDIEEPAEMSGVNTEALKAFEVEKYGHLVRADEIEWATVDESVDPKRLFSWREVGDVLTLRYLGTSHDTNWETIRRLLKYKVGGERTGEIVKVIKSNTGKKIVAFRTFLRYIEAGIIKLPPADGDKELDVMYSTFAQEVDPDKPMLAGLNLTKIKEGCGEGVEC